MDYTILALYILGALLVMPAIIIILDLARLSTFLFYDKKIIHLQQKTMIKPIVGNRIYGLKNILVMCILLPSVLLIYYRGEVFKDFLGLSVFYGLAIINFILISFSSHLGRKLQIETQTRTHAKYLFIVEIVLLISWFSLTMLYFNKIEMII
ncbi:MAG: hypothetical protein ACOH1O_06285 [Flavobacterium sp.]